MLKQSPDQILTVRAPQPGLGSDRNEPELITALLTHLGIDGCSDGSVISAWGNEGEGGDWSNNGNSNFGCEADGLSWVGRSMRVYANGGTPPSMAVDTVNQKSNQHWHFSAVIDSNAFITRFFFGNSGDVGSTLLDVRGSSSGGPSMHYIVDNGVGFDEPAGGSCSTVTGVWALYEWERLPGGTIILRQDGVQVAMGVDVNRSSYANPSVISFYTSMNGTEFPYIRFAKNPQGLAAWRAATAATYGITL